MDLGEGGRETVMPERRAGVFKYSGGRQGGMSRDGLRMATYRQSPRKPRG